MSLQPDASAAGKAISDIADLISHYADRHYGRVAVATIASQWSPWAFVPTAIFPIGSPPGGSIRLLPTPPP